MTTLALLITRFSSVLWALFLPLLLLLGAGVLIFTILAERRESRRTTQGGGFRNIKAPLAISVASKVGTGSVIGVLAAMWRGSDSGVGGEAVVLWALIAMAFLVPLTYCEVKATQMAGTMPRRFVTKNINARIATIYAGALVLLYSFGFVGFQFTGIQTALGVISQHWFEIQFTAQQMLFFVIIPMVIITALIIITRNHGLFTNVLGSLIGIVVVLYTLVFILFVAKTLDFANDYVQAIWTDFCRFRTAATGIPIGLVLAFQRIIQTSETVLGTSAMAASDRRNGPRGEARIQVMATLITLFIAMVITSYVYIYGREHFPDVMLTANGVQRVQGYITTLYRVTGPFGLAVILIYFLLSGYCTVLGSYHFVNTTLRLQSHQKIVLYLGLITLSGLLSLSHFSMIFDFVDLLMFLVGAIFIVALFRDAYHRFLGKTQNPSGSENEDTPRSHP
ncbi:MAG: alanine:cation symporter family protein [Spirochaetales bacterium]|nr:alanine:cation symporter family protein [Spirochaetales bacterium]